MSETLVAKSVALPLRGEWCAVNTPGFKIPSHGTEMLGQGYAYDFVQIDWSKKKGFKFFDSSIVRWLSIGVPLERFYCWDEAIYSPFDAEVVETHDGVAERAPVRFFRDLYLAYKNGLTFNGKSNADLVSLLGNYIILKTEDCYALIAHARTGSVRVSSGDRVTEGEWLANVGHSGNSTAPHLHFQLMDRADLITAKGVPCKFKQYQLFDSERWQDVKGGIPGKRERIRL